MILDYIFCQSRIHTCLELTKLLKTIFPFQSGPVHWLPLAKARALDNQVFVATVAPARDEKADYIAWGHSTVVDPWGDVLGSAEAGETVFAVDINLDRLNEVRAQVPITHQRRTDLFDPPKPK